MSQESSIIYGMSSCYILISILNVQLFNHDYLNALSGLQEDTSNVISFFQSFTYEKANGLLKAVTSTN